MELDELARVEGAGRPQHSCARPSECTAKLSTAHVVAGAVRDRHLAVSEGNGQAVGGPLLNDGAGATLCT